MKRTIFRSIAVAIVAFALYSAAYSQSTQNSTVKADRDRNVAVVIVGSAAKAAWVTTKFAAKHVAKPVLKAVFLKAAPKVTMYALNNSPRIAAKVAPTALKLALL